MRFMVIEDEKLAAERLINMVQQLDPASVLVGTADSVKSAVHWYKNNPKPDLIFMDIQLADGLSFSIFEKIKIDTPIIFTTAYNVYAIKAFKVNSIDYLLKPIDKAELSLAMEKFNRLYRNRETTGNVYDAGLMKQVLQMFANPYKTRFVVKVGEHLRHINQEELSHFSSLEKETFLNTFSGKIYGLDQSLDQLEELVDPRIFFRINRKYLINLKSIKDIISYSGSRLKLILNTSGDEDILVSREKVQDFKDWLEGEKK
jgi:two-component system LytT family response regulator